MEYLELLPVSLACALIAASSILKEKKDNKQKRILLWISAISIFLVAVSMPVYLYLEDLIRWEPVSQNILVVFQVVRWSVVAFGMIGLITFAITIEPVRKARN